MLQFPFTLTIHCLTCTPIFLGRNLLLQKWIKASNSIVQSYLMFGCLPDGFDLNNYISFTLTCIGQMHMHNIAWNLLTIQRHTYLHICILEQNFSVFVGYQGLILIGKLKMYLKYILSRGLLFCIPPNNKIHPGISDCTRPAYHKTK